MRRYGELTDTEKVVGISGLEILIGLKNSALRGGQISEVERYQVWSENGMLTPEF